MCDPGKLLTGLFGGGSGGGGSAAPAGDPEAERMKAEAEAATSANLRLAATQRRRREQASLMARGGLSAIGGSQPTLGEDKATGDSTLNRSPMWDGAAGLRAKLAPAIAAASLMSRGSDPGVPGSTNSRKRLPTPVRGF